MKLINPTDYVFEPSEIPGSTAEPASQGDQQSHCAPSQQRPRGRFLKGPVPMSWVLAAGNLPGKALLVGIHLWHWRGWKKKDEFRFSGQRCSQELGINRSTVHRALHALEKAKLVQIVWGTGRSPVVRLLDALREPDSDDLSEQSTDNPTRVLGENQLFDTDAAIAPSSSTRVSPSVEKPIPPRTA